MGTKPLFLMFDLDDTLYDRAVPLGQALEEVLKEDTRNRTVESEAASCSESGKNLQRSPAWRQELKEHLREWYQIYGRCSQEMFERHESGEISLEESRILRIQKAVRESMQRFPQIFRGELNREQAIRFQQSYERCQGQIALSEELRTLLQRLTERGVSMGILTNGPTVHQKKKIRALGLDQWIPEEYVLISEQVGFAKPDPEIFRAAEAQMQLSGYQVWMIGDSLKGDIAGAAAAGWKTVWLNRDGQQAGNLPDCTVCTEKEMAEGILEIVEGAKDQ